VFQLTGQSYRRSPHGCLRRRYCSELVLQARAYRRLAYRLDIAREITAISHYSGCLAPPYGLQDRNQPGREHGYPEDEHVARAATHGASNALPRGKLARERACGSPNGVQVR
jgi:hypothetical protein